MTDSGDEHLRSAGVVLPCARQFGWLGAVVHRCDRPYGHTGPHAADGSAMTGERNAEDEARTATVLAQLLQGSNHP